MAELSKPLEPTAEKVSILLVDDISANFLSLQAILEDREYHLVETRSGEEALERLKAQEFAVILLGVQLPGLGGFDTAKLIRADERSQHTPIIFLSADDIDRAQVEAGYALGAVDFFTRPLSPVVVQAKVRGFARLFLEKQRAKNEAAARQVAHQVRELLRVTLESIREAVISTDALGCVTSLNPVAERLVGWKSGEAAGCSLEDVFRIVNEETWQPVENPALEALKDGKIDGLANLTVLISKDGAERLIDASAAPIWDEAGNVSGSVLVFWDISERMRSEEALAERMRLLTLNAAVGEALVKADGLGAILQHCAEALVKHLEGAFARVWTLNETDAVLELQASAGMYTHLDGPHSRVPVGKYKIGLIAQERQPHLTNAVVGDSRVSDQEWAKREGMVSFAGYPLVVGGRLVGVMAMFARHPLNDFTLRAMASVADVLAIGIKRNKSEQSLWSSEARNKAILETALDCIITMDHEGNIVEFNPAAERTFGFRREQAIGHELADLIIPPKLRERHRKGMARYLATGQGAVLGKRLELLALRADGTEFPAELAITRLPTTGPPLFTAYLRDITERKRAEEDLRLRDRAIQAVSEGILILDVNQPENPIIYASSGFERLTGYATAEAVGRNCRFLQGPDSDTNSAAQLQEAIQAGRHCKVEILNYRKNGTPFWNALSLSPIRNDRGELTHFVVVQADVTARRGLEEQLRQSQKMEAIGSLAGGVAHDFNNLLTVINGYSDLIQSQLPDESPVRGLAHEIGQAGERAASLTRQLLAFSRKQVLEPKVLNLNAVVTDTARMLKRLIGEDIELATALDSALGQVSADPNQIEQVLINLAVNARDAMPRGGKLTIKTANAELDQTYTQAYLDLRPGLYVMLAVADTGTGMDRETEARIFEPFFTTKEPGKGTGLGLATVFGIVKQSGGHVTAYSQPDHGTTFKVYLPRVEERVTATTSHPRSETVPLGSETILLVEDEPALLALARRILQRQGYTVLEAGNGETALRIGEEYQGAIHLLMTDVIMPGMSGRQVAERLTIQRPGVKVLFLSGYTDDAVVRHGILQAETAFLQKPYTPTALAQKVREVLDQPDRTAGTVV